VRNQLLPTTSYELLVADLQMTSQPTERHLSFKSDNDTFVHFVSSGRAVSGRNVGNADGKCLRFLITL